MLRADRPKEEVSNGKEVTSSNERHCCMPGMWTTKMQTLWPELLGLVERKYSLKIFISKMLRVEALGVQWNLYWVATNQDNN